MTQLAIMIIAITYLLSLDGCELFHRPVSRADVVGTYSANYPGMIDSLVLREDGNYLHYFYDSSGSLYADSGSWAPEVSDGEAEPTTFRNIVLHDFCSRYTLPFGVVDITNSNCPTFYTIIYKLNDNVRISIAIDFELYYEKKK